MHYDLTIILVKAIQIWQHKDAIEPFELVDTECILGRFRELNHLKVSGHFIFWSFFGNYCGDEPVQIIYDQAHLIVIIQIFF